VDGKCLEDRLIIQSSKLSGGSRQSGPLDHSDYNNQYYGLSKLLLCVVLNRLREQLTARGSTTIRGLGRTFKLLDSYDGNRKVDGGEFFVGLQENGVKITKAEADVSLVSVIFICF
jgi:hypothetical protein